MNVNIDYILNSNQYYDSITYQDYIIKKLINLCCDNDYLEFKQKEWNHINFHMNSAFYHYSFDLNKYKLFINKVIRRFCIKIPTLVLSSFYVNLYNQKYILTRKKFIIVYIASLIIADKYLNDYSFETKTWSYITRFDKKRMMDIELSFLKSLDYRVHVDKDVFYEYCAKFFKYL